MALSQNSNGGLKLILGLVVAAILAGVGYYYFQQGTANKPSEAVKLADNVLGKADAPITIIEYSSMTCGHCATFHNETLPGLKEKYIKTGKVKYIVREYPLDQLATAAFMLGRCLPKKDAYFDFVDLLYAKQKEWAFVEEPVGALKKLAKQAGFTDESFKTCLDDKNLFAQVLAVKNAGSEEFRIRSTPTFFVNGTRLEGAQPLEEFEKLFKPLLDE